MRNSRRARDNARSLRKRMTDAELRLWQHLRGRQLFGYKFRRQHPVGPFVVDFACLEAGLVVEVDGGQHLDERAKDEARSRVLEAHGFRVVRFWNDEVLKETEVCLEVIGQALGPRAPDAPGPHPGPPPRAGEGEDE